MLCFLFFFFFFQAEDGIRDHCVTGVQTCALPISTARVRVRKVRSVRRPNTVLRTHLTFLTLTLAVAVLTCRETKPTSAVRPRVQETNEALARAALRPSLEYPSVARFDSLITHCDHSDSGCLQVVEDSQLPLAGGRAYRDSVGLHLRLRDGTFLLLADDTSEGSSSVHYSF